MHLTMHHQQQEVLGNDEARAFWDELRRGPVKSKPANRNECETAWQFVVPFHDAVARGADQEGIVATIRREFLEEVLAQYNLKGSPPKSVGERLQLAVSAADRIAMPEGRRSEVIRDLYLYALSDDALGLLERPLTEPDTARINAQAARAVLGPLYFNALIAPGDMHYGRNIKPLVMLLDARGDGARSRQTRIMKRARSQLARLQNLLPELRQGDNVRLAIIYRAVMSVVQCWRRRSGALRTMSDVLGSTTLEIAEAACHEDPVLVTGPTGTGKERTALAIHQLSRRAREPFIAANVGGLPRELVSSELFGHEPGTFTGAIGRRLGYFEDSQRGTLFLDEIGDAPLEVQVRLLRALSEKKIVRLGSTKELPIDVRFVAATNRNLEEDVSNGRFREDLYFRLRPPFAIHLRPLSERAGDELEDLWTTLVKERVRDCMSKEEAEVDGLYEVLASGVTSDRKLLDALKSRSWGGNVRELEQFARDFHRVGERLGDFSGDAAVMYLSRVSPREVDEDQPRHPRRSLDHFLDAMQLSLIEEVLEGHEDFSRAARILGLKDAALRKRLSRLGRRLGR